MKTTSSHAVSVKTSAMLAFNLLRQLRQDFCDADAELSKLSASFRGSGWSMFKDHSFAEELDRILLERERIRSKYSRAINALDRSGPELKKGVEELAQASSFRLPFLASQPTS